MTLLIVCGSGAEERNECSTALCEQVALAKEVSERPGVLSADCTQLVLRKERDGRCSGSGGGWRETCSKSSLQLWAKFSQS